MILAVKPFGPNQFTMCSRSVQTLKTRLRGASKTRVMTTSRSDALVATLVLAPIFLLLNLNVAWTLVRHFHVVGEALEAARPAALMVVTRSYRFEHALPQGKLRLS